MNTSALARLASIGMLCAVLPALAASAGTAAGSDPADNGMLGTTDGMQIYTQICQGCHMSAGRGAIGAGYYPALAGNANLASSNYMAVTILNGRRNMPSFVHVEHPKFFFPTTWLSDTQIANVINYVRSHFGNHYDNPINPAEVAALHTKESKP